MKSFYSNSTQQASRGVALVIVLSSLVLLSALIILLMNRATVDRANAASFRSTLDARNLRDYAVNIVQGQITSATTDNPALAWASQPGVIRTFSASGPALEQIYKLYSAPALRGNTIAALTSDTDSLANWNNNPALFTDLNEPVETADGLLYPILDPRALGQVEGFEILAGTPSTPDQAAPMPVWWLYILEDGTLVSPSGPTAANSTTVDVAGASEDNPIVGRIAFWADDETAKININTASEGSYWDVPRYFTPFERNSLAAIQPAQNEFQRYPGHPATTSLAPVFFANSATSTPDLTLEQREALYEITPRVVGGGSMGGSVVVPVGTDPLPVGTDRLYATVGEFLYSTDRPAANSLSSKVITDEMLERARFFLTANNRAPETTLFNTPRVAVWPTHATDDTRRTAFDRLVRLCATLNGSLYAFQRADSRSTTNDWNNIPRNGEVLRYLQRETGASIPGFGGNFAAKFGSADRDQLLVQILDYVRSTNLYDENLPTITYSSITSAENALQFTAGRGSSTFLGYNGHGQVVPLRVPAGLSGTSGSSTAASPSTSDHMGFGRFTTISEAGLLFICMADGSAGTENAPIGDPANAELQKKRESNRASAADGAGLLSRALNGVKLEPDEKLIQTMLFFEWFSPMTGWTGLMSDFFIEVEQDGGVFRINGEDLGIPNLVRVEQLNESSRNTPGRSATAGANGLHPWGGSASARAFLTGRNAPARGPMPADSTSNLYGLISAPLRIKTTGGTMDFTGPNKVVLRIYAGRPGQSATHQLVQTIDLKFPDATFPIPDLVLDGTRPFPDEAPETNYQNWWTFHRAGIGLENGNPGRLGNIHHRPSGNAGKFVRSTDVLRTLVPFHGDYRLVAGSHYVPLGVFQPSEHYFSTDPAHRIRSFLTGSASADSFIDRDASNRIAMSSPETSFFQDPDNALVSGLDYLTTWTSKFPDIPVFRATAGSPAVPANTFQTTGDFDNAHGEIFDGPYINKPDEGTSGNPGHIPYFEKSWQFQSAGPTYFSPNRQISSAGMFGSLPVHTRSGNAAFDLSSPSAAMDKAWRTLLFRPQNGHPGENDPPDYLLLDLFWMPVVDPYAISEPLSTAGKVNLNYEIQPFTYLRRSTGVRALLRSERVTAVPDSSHKIYKSSSSDMDTRFPIDAQETLRQFERVFADGDIFRSETQLCSLHLIPEGTTLNADGSNADTVMGTYWSSRRITGDNMRERPYTNLVGRSTTKSNTFTVHYRVEALKKAPGGSQTVWDEERDAVTASLRGAATIERYVDPGDPEIPDYAGLSVPPPAADALPNRYRWRTLSDIQFNP
jgi:uncharacterized protein (TIGR02600 family)